MDLSSVCLYNVHANEHLLFFRNDVLREDRAIGDATRADQSNFLHPVLYYYSTPPATGELIASRHTHTEYIHSDCVSYRTTGFNCECRLIANCFSTQLLQLQSALLLRAQMCKPYTNAIIETQCIQKCWNKLFCYAIKTGPTVCHVMRLHVPHVYVNQASLSTARVLVHCLLLGRAPFRSQQQSKALAQGSDYTRLLHNPVMYCSNARYVHVSVYKSC